MDASALVGVVGGYVAMALTIVGAIYAAVNHKRVRSNCCGSRGEISLDVDTMQANSTPSPKLSVQQVCPSVPELQSTPPV
jgi:hypothetical protein